MAREETGDAGALRKRAEELLVEANCCDEMERVSQRVVDAMLAFHASESEREALEGPATGSAMWRLGEERQAVGRDAVHYETVDSPEVVRRIVVARARGAEEALLLARQRLRDAAKYDSVRILDEQLADLRQPAAPANERIEWRTGSEWEDVDGADGSKPIVPEPLRQPRPAQEADVFEKIVVSLRDLSSTTEWESDVAAILRERFGPAVEALEKIADHPSVDDRKLAYAALSRLRAAGGSG